MDCKYLGKVIAVNTQFRILNIFENVSRIFPFGLDAPNWCNLVTGQ